METKMKTTSTMW